MAIIAWAVDSQFGVKQFVRTSVSAAIGAKKTLNIWHHIVWAAQKEWTHDISRIELTLSMPGHRLQCKLIPHFTHTNSTNLIRILQSSPLYPSELVQLRGALDPQICPENSEIVAYISSGDIWVINMVSGEFWMTRFAKLYTSRTTSKHSRVWDMHQKNCHWKKILLNFFRSQ